MFSKSKASSDAPAPRSLGAAAAGERSGKPAAPSILSGSLTVRGDLDSTGDIQIDGVVEGDIRSHKVTVGETARVIGAVIADHIRIAGAVEGEITGREVTLTASARVAGDIYHDRLAIEAGAHMQGLCRRVEDVETRLAAVRDKGQGADRAAAGATGAAAEGPADTPAAKTKAPAPSPHPAED